MSNTDDKSNKEDAMLLLEEQVKSLNKIVCDINDKNGKVLNILSDITVKLSQQNSDIVNIKMDNKENKIAVDQSIRQLEMSNNEMITTNMKTEKHIESTTETLNGVLEAVKQLANVITTATGMPPLRMISPGDISKGLKAKSLSIFMGNLLHNIWFCQGVENNDRSNRETFGYYMNISHMLFQSANARDIDKKSTKKEACLLEEISLFIMHRSGKDNYNSRNSDIIPLASMVSFFRNAPAWSFKSISYYIEALVNKLDFVIGDKTLYLLSRISGCNTTEFYFRPQHNVRNRTFGKMIGAFSTLETDKNIQDKLYSSFEDAKIRATVKGIRWHDETQRGRMIGLMKNLVYGNVIDDINNLRQMSYEQPAPAPVDVADVINVLHNSGKLDKATADQAKKQVMFINMAENPGSYNNSGSYSENGTIHGENIYGSEDEFADLQDNVTQRNMEEESTESDEDLTEIKHSRRPKMSSKASKSKPKLNSKSRSNSKQDKLVEGRSSTLSDKKKNGRIMRIVNDKDLDDEGFPRSTRFRVPPPDISTESDEPEVSRVKVKKTKSKVLKKKRSR